VLQPGFCAGSHMIDLGNSWCSTDTPENVMSWCSWRYSWYH
jgi:hypothetical protein